MKFQRMCDKTMEKSFIIYLNLIKRNAITCGYEKHEKMYIDKHFHKCENNFYSIIVYNYARDKMGRLNPLLIIRINSASRVGFCFAKQGGQILSSSKDSDFASQNKEDA